MCPSVQAGRKLRGVLLEHLFPLTLVLWEKHWYKGLDGQKEEVLVL